MELLPLILAFVSRSRPRNRGWEEEAILQCSNPGMIFTPPPHNGLVRIRRTESGKGEMHFAPVVNFFVGSRGKVYGQSA